MAGLRLVDPGRVHAPAGTPRATPAPERVPAQAPAEAVAVRSVPDDAGGAAPPAASEAADRSLANPPQSVPPAREASAPITDFESSPASGVAVSPVPASLLTGPMIQIDPAALPGAEGAPPVPAVLIVDDNVRLASTVAAYMEMQGFRAHPANSAEEALRAAQQVHFDLVLLDINMPGMDGLEVCHRLLATSPGMRVLMVTGRDSQEDPLRAAAVGARGLLTKPISLASLRDEMLRALAS
ncbi:MAG: response regulator [Candidatus Dormibacteria bacterium]